MCIPKFTTLVLQFWPQIIIFSKISIILIASNGLKYYARSNIFGRDIFEAYIYIIWKKCEAGYSDSDLIDQNIDLLNILIIYQLNLNVSNQPHYFFKIYRYKPQKYSVRKPYV